MNLLYMYHLISPPSLLFTMLSGKRNVLCPSERESVVEDWMGERKGECIWLNMFIWGHVVSLLLLGVFRKKICYQWEMKWDPLGVNKRVIATMLLYVSFYLFFIFETNTSMVKNVTCLSHYTFFSGFQSNQKKLHLHVNFKSAFTVEGSH